MDEDDYAVIPVEEIEVAPQKLNNKVKRPLSDKQKENLVKLVEYNKVRWEKGKEDKVKKAEEEKDRIRAELRAEHDAKVQAGTHMRVKVVKKNTGPKPKPKGEKPKALPVISETDPESDTEVTETEVDTEDEVPEPRHVARQARKQMRTLAKIDNVIEQASNPYMSKLLGRWK